MAASISKQNSIEKADEHLLRLFLLIKNVGTKACQHIFYKYFPRDSKQLYQTIQPYKKILKPILFPDQYELIFENINEEIDASSFDITLFLLLFRKCCPSLSPPKRGWNKRPSITDTSESANLERLRGKRNSLAHAGSVSLTTVLFDKKWRSCKNLLLSLGADVDEIDSYSSIQLDLTNNSDSEDRISILLDKLFQHFDESLYKYNENEEKFQRLQEEIDILRGSVRCSSSNDDCNVSVQELSSRLKSLYSRREKLISCLEWDDDRTGYFELEDIFIQPQLYGWDVRRSLCEHGALDLYSIVSKNILNDRLQPINICIISDPGKGKSVLLQKVALDYSNNLACFKNNFPFIECVILIRCRDLIKYKNVGEYICDQMLKDVTHAKEKMFLRLLKNISEKIVFLIDGYDEIQHCTDHQSNITDELESILSGTLYYGASIIATTRPSGLKTFTKPLNLFKEKYIIAPLTSDQINDYLTKYFSEKDQTYCTKLYEEIVNNETIMELASSPLALSIICNIRDRSECIPSNMTELYHELIVQMIKKFKANYGFTNKTQKRRVSDFLLNSIGQIALNSLHAGKDHFQQQDLVNHFKNQCKKKTFFNKISNFTQTINSTTILQLGFLRADSGTNPRQLNWFYQFEPKLCQKYVAAEFVVNKLLKYGISRGLKKALPVTTTLNPIDVLRHDHELCLFIVDGFGRRGEKDMCKKLFNELFHEFGNISIE